MNISITFDVEIWCDGWKNLDAEFPKAFRRYIYGADMNGYALPRTLQILNEHHLKGVFFVEPLFSYRFGIEPLQAIVDLIVEAGHEIQLHVHPEWSDETDPPLVHGATRKRQHLYEYTLDEQTTLIAKGIEALERCGVRKPTAFRAGGYGCDVNTLRAAAANNIFIDSSFNLASRASKAEGLISNANIQPQVLEGVLEYPVTVFRDGIGRCRHWQVASTGYRESIALLRQAKRLGYRHLVLVSHSFELLYPDSSKPDRIMVSRFEKLCRWLDANREDFAVIGFPLNTTETQTPGAELSVPFPATVARLFAQGARRTMASAFK